MTELIGQNLGSYQLEALLATGPTGPLYRGRHIRLARPAAIKLFAPELVARAGVRPRLLAALRDIGALSHPRLTALYDIGDEAGRLFVATELLSGGNLRDIAQAGSSEQVPLAVRLELVAQAADGLGVAHAAGVVHGAVKPESLWLERRLDQGAPALKLGDLGVAAALPDEALGAPAYLSPEQCRGQALDGRADLYSLGVVLYELLVGAPPFHVTSVEEAIEQHLHTKPAPLRRARPDLPAEVEAITLRCLAKSPAERYPDAATLAAALRQVIASLTPTPRLDEPPRVAAPAPKPGGTPTRITPTPAPRVQILGPQGAVLYVADLAAGTLTAGRSPERDLFLDDSQISRDHLRIGWDGARVMVTDLGSANGSFLGETRLAPNVPTPWDGQPPLRLGPFSLRLASAAARPAADDSLLTGLLGETTAVAAAAPAQPSRPGRIALRVEQEDAQLTPGAPALIALRLTNTGNTPEEVSLAVEGVPAAWLSGGDRQVHRLAPGAQAAASLTVTVPRSPEALAGDYNVVVRARPLSGAEGAVARLRWSVLPYRGLELRITPPTVESRAAADYQVLLRNTGNAPASYFLSFEDEDDLLGYALAEDEVALDPGQTARVGLRVEAAGRLFGGLKERPFTVRADDGAREVAEAEASLVHLASLPPWVPLAGLAILALALLLGAWALLGNPGSGGTAAVPTGTVTPLPPTLTPLPTPQPGAPTVQRFTAEPQVVAPGDLVLVTWQVQGAERVFIDQFGDVPPEGQREFRPEQTTDFRLTALAPGGRETVVIARVNVTPPTAVPPTPTPVPPTPVPPTPVPPTPVPPTPVPPTPVPPTPVPPTPVPPTGDPAVDLVNLAPGALWRTGAGQVPFGPPAAGAEQAGWAAVAAATLEDGRQYEGLLQMVPPAGGAEGAAPFIEGEYAILPLQRGQILVGAVGHQQGASSQSITVSITLDGQILYQGVSTPDGRLLPIFADLSAYAGRGGRLALRVSASDGAAPGGVYWVRPRIDVPR